MGPVRIKGEKRKEVLIESESKSADPWTLYLYAMRSPATKEKYLIRLGKFLNFLNLQGSIEEKARAFAAKGKDDSIWAFNEILKFDHHSNSTIIIDTTSHDSF